LQDDRDVLEQAGAFGMLPVEFDFFGQTVADIELLDVIGAAEEFFFVAEKQ